MGSFINQPEFGTEVGVVTPSDTIDATTYINRSALYCGVGGDLKVIIQDVGPVNGGYPTAADAIVFKNVPNGGFLPVIVDYVLATGTTATDILTIK